MTAALAVWLEGRRIGTLDRVPRRGFQYVPGVDERLTVAAAGMTAWSPELTRNWFDGLLPEGDRRARVARRFDVRPEDTFGLLAQIGWECAGAVAILPEGRSPDDGRYEAIDDTAVGQRLDDLPSRDLDDDDAMRMSLGGAQEKLLLARRDGSWALPIDGAPSTHILKPEPAIWPGLAVAEAWSLQVARAATHASEAAVAQDLGTRPVIVVTRYDREIRGDSILRRHQEDLCQALGLPPSAKYARHPARPDDPSFAHLARIIQERAANPPNELVRLLAQVTVTVALRNADAHAKNFSVLHDGDAVSLSPMYDVSPTTAFLPTQTTLGLSVGGKFRMADVGTEQMVQEAVAWGVPSRVALDTVRQVASDLAAGVEQADESYPDLPSGPRDVAMAGIDQIQRPRPGGSDRVTVNRSRGRRRAMP